MDFVHSTNVSLPLISLSDNVSFEMFNNSQNRSREIRFRAEDAFARGISLTVTTFRRIALSLSLSPLSQVPFHAVIGNEISNNGVVSRLHVITSNESL